MWHKLCDTGTGLCRVLFHGSGYVYRRSCVSSTYAYYLIVYWTLDSNLSALRIVLGLTVMATVKWAKCAKRCSNSHMIKQLYNFHVLLNAISMSFGKPDWIKDNQFDICSLNKMAAIISKLESSVTFFFDYGLFYPILAALQWYDIQRSTISYWRTLW